MIRLAIIPGDGIGPEVISETVPVLEWANARGLGLHWQFFPYGADHFLRCGETLSENHFRELRDQFDAILFGAIGDPRVPDGRHAEAILLRLRQDLELHVNYRPCVPMLDSHVPLKDTQAADIRIEVFRENTEGPYCLKGVSKATEATDFAIHTEPAIKRLLTAAFEWASREHRPLTLAHKANVLKHGHGLWMRVFELIRKDFPHVPSRGMHADALLCELIRHPKAFGVIAADNFIGDLVSDLLAACQGGMGVAPSASWAPHRPYRCTALFEPVHGSAPDLAGTNRANPIGALLSVALFFKHFGGKKEGQLVEQAAVQVLASGASTEDLGGTLSCSEMGKLIHHQLRKF